VGCHNSIMVWKKIKQLSTPTDQIEEDETRLVTSIMIPQEGLSFCPAGA
jgi:hypothetical protein